MPPPYKRLIPGDWVKLEQIINELFSIYLNEDTSFSELLSDINVDSSDLKVVSDSLADTESEQKVISDALSAEIAAPDCPNYKYLKATGQSEGDLHLSDGTNWAISKALILLIRVLTSSTDWDLYLLQNDNGFAANDANIPMLKIMADGDGNANIRVNYPYEDEDASDEVHLYYIDNSGTNTADIYVIGYELV